MDADQHSVHQSIKRAVFMDIAHTLVHESIKRSIFMDSHSRLFSKSMNWCTDFARIFLYLESANVKASKLKHPFCATKAKYVCKGLIIN